MNGSLPFFVNLEGRTAVVTGGAGVLCRAFCVALARCGASVAVLGRTFSKVQQLAQEIQAEGGRALALAADVTDGASLQEARDTIAETFGACHILINGAGGNHPSATTENEFLCIQDMEGGRGKTFFDLEPESFSSVFSLNMMGTLLPIQVFARDMAAAGGGCIVNISSMNAFTPLTKIPAYSAAKAAVSNFTQWLAVHFAPSHIRVNAIAPGFFSTRQNASLLWNQDGSPTERTKKILSATPMGRFGVPEELVGTLLYLVDTQASGFVTGVVLPVDGGFNAYSGV